jgi:L-cysteine S-thiosulfotransferase
MQLSSLMMLSVCVMSSGIAAGTDAIAIGRQLAHSYEKGNCLACHRIPGDASAVTLATLGPPLVNVRERFALRDTLRAQLWDSTVSNPNTIMPPFGKNGVLTSQEIEQIIDYIYQY